MKKLFVVLVTLALLFGMGGVAFATITPTYAGGSGLGTVRTACFINGTSSADSGTASVTTAIIPGKCRVLGWDVMCTTSASTYADIQDTATYSAGSYTISDVEATQYTSLSGKWIPQGIEVARGISIRCGAYSSITVYYVQDIP
jgi:hypothetical protein